MVQGPSPGGSSVTCFLGNQLNGLTVRYRGEEERVCQKVPEV